MIRRLRASLVAKLLVAQLLVIVAGATTLALVALAVAPGLFHDHVRDALGVVPDDVARHLDEAFGDAVLLSLAIAVAAATITAAFVSWFLSVRIVRPIGRLAAAAERVSRGSHGERVPVTGSDELSVLAAAFNDMAGSLESAEIRRRQLLGDLAHELRTPLATIEGYVEGVRDGVVPAGAETWEVLESEARRIRRLVDDLQKVSRAEERQLDLRVRLVEPAALVAGAVKAAGPAYAAKGVALEMDVTDALPLVPVDPDRLGEVLANLLDNALRHTPSGGRVEVRAEAHGEEVDLAVSDSGEGIAGEHLGRIFERFYRADSGRTRARGGSGIGLAIARALVEAHGGRIRAESEGPGTGSRFVVSLPVAAS
ncbi:MAG TPA: ATP-binding protein [Gaiellaceae bacterium]|nr:ATP-binding protein [Gaiellaceae bacterium]